MFGNSSPVHKFVDIVQTQDSQYERHTKKTNKERWDQFLQMSIILDLFLAVTKADSKLKPILNYHLK